MKMRDELETVVGDGEVLQHVFEELGLHVWFRYQKYREEFAAEEVTIALDETPVGTYVEIEGGEHGHPDDDRGARPHRGGFHPRFLPRRCSSVTASRFGINGQHMVFREE